MLDKMRRSWIRAVGSFFGCHWGAGVIENKFHPFARMFRISPRV